MGTPLKPSGGGLAPSSPQSPLPPATAEQIRIVIQQIKNMRPVQTDYQLYKGVREATMQGLSKIENAVDSATLQSLY